MTLKIKRHVKAAVRRAVSAQSVASAVSAAIVTVLKFLPALPQLVWRRRLLLIKPLMTIKLALKKLHSKTHQKAIATNAAAVIVMVATAVNAMVIVQSVLSARLIRLLSP